MNYLKEAYEAITSPHDVIQKIHESTDTKKNVVDGTIQKRDGYIILAFSATNSKQDIIADCSIFPRRIPFTTQRLYGHGGYVKHYMNAREQILSAVKDYDNILITGYSLGASIALLASLDIQTVYNKQVHTVVFDPLRTFFWNKPTVNAELYTYGNSTVYKLLRCFGFVHGGNIVQVGPKYKWWKYNHDDHKLHHFLPPIQSV